jgi:dihydroorotase
MLSKSKLKFTAWKHGFKIKEVPITFTDRTEGTSKMSGVLLKKQRLEWWSLNGKAFPKNIKRRTYNFMPAFIIKNALLVNEGKIFEADVFVKDEFIERIDRDISHRTATVIDANGNTLIPGCIDDQVHFREPGLTHKGDIHTESRAAVAGGITSYMEMPNTVPNAVTQQLLEEKYALAEKKSFANYSFFMGTTNDNLDELLKTNPKKVCGIKIFMGSSTGNMLVDNHSTLEKIFSQSPVLIATHCEDEATIKRNSEIFRQKFGEDVPIKYHPEIRSAEACYLSSSYAVSLAKKYGTRLQYSPRVHCKRARFV